MERKQNKPTRKASMQYGVARPKDKTDGMVERRRDRFLKPFKQMLRASSPGADEKAKQSQLELVSKTELGATVTQESDKEGGTARLLMTEKLVIEPIGEKDDGDGEYIVKAEAHDITVTATGSLPASVLPTLDGAILNARVGIAAMQSPAILGNSEQQESFKMTFEVVLRKLDAFSAFVEDLADVHPFAKMAYKILFFASDAIVQQMNLDNDICDLVDLLNKTYMFVNEAQEVADMLPQVDVLKQLAFKTVEVAHFVVEYSKNKNFWLRTCKNLVSSAQERTTVFKTEFDELMTDFRNHSALHTQANVFRLLGKLDHLSGDFDLNSLEYAKGATGYNTSKQCLPTTRVQILDDISNWVNDQKEDAPNVMWVSGGAGTGKSTIAHTIAKRFSELRRLGSSFSFDKNAAGDRRHEKIFSTIARDLADLDPTIKSALSEVLHNASASVKSTSDIFQQWDTFVLETIHTIYDRSSEASGASIIGPILIIIDALDESGDDIKTRSALLSILSGDKGSIRKLPPNFRILVTSRPSVDIYSNLQDRAHILIKSMDEIPDSTTKADISSYISDRLLPQLEDFLDAQHLQELVNHSDGLFQWAYLACEYMLGTSFGGLTVEEKFDDLCSNSSDVTGDVLLQDMYYLILSKLFDIKRPTIRARFQSVMGQILATLEPLPQTSLNFMRSRFPGISKTNSDISVIVNHMGSLLSGITNKSIPIRPVHTSFYDFLKDKNASKEFFVDLSSAQKTLAFSSLDVMIDSAGLKFNIAGIQSSFTENVNLGADALKLIPPHLGYACKFWANHLPNVEPNDEILSLIHALFFEKFPFWLEVLALTKSVNKCIEALTISALWIPDESPDLKSFAEDAKKFIHMFGGLIDESVPHIYLSAIPFVPQQSVIYQTYSKFLKHILKITEGFLDNWPSLQLTITTHYDAVNFAAFSPNGALIASASDDETVCVCDAVTGEEMYIFQDHNDCVNALAFSPKGDLIASCSEDGNILVWNTLTGVIMYTFEHKNDVARFVAFSPDGSQLVAILEKLHMCIYQIGSGKRLRVFGKDLDPMHCIAFSPDNSQIVSCSEDTKIYIWDAKTGKQLKVLDSHDDDADEISSVAFSPVDQNLLVVGSYDDTVYIWDIAKSAKIHTLEEHTDAVNSVAFSSDGSKIISGADDTNIIIWNAITGEIINTLEGHSDWVQSVQFSPDNLQIVSASVDNTVCVWDAIAGQTLEVLEGHSAWIAAVALSPNGDFIVSASHDFTIGIWNSATGQLIKYLEDGHDGCINTVAVSSDNLWVLSGSDDEIIVIWDIKTGGVIKTLKGHTDSINSVAFNQDNSQVMSASVDQLVHIWNVETEKVTLVFDKHSDSVCAAQFSPIIGIAASSATDNITYIWNSTTGEILHTLKEHTDWVYNIVFSSEGEHLVTGSHDYALCIWDTNTGEMLRKIEQSDTVTSVSYSHDGTKIVAGSDDHLIYIWDATTGLMVKQLEGHSGSVQAAVFSHDDMEVISCGADKMIRVWNLEKNQDDIPTILFSDNQSHALKITEDFLSYTPVVEEEESNHEDTDIWNQMSGWAIGPKKQLLFWIPPQLHSGLFTPNTSFLIGPQKTVLDLSDFVYGSEWQKCFIQD